jgi:hypothetical protein
MGGSADMSNNVTMLPISVDQALAALSVANLFLGGIARSTTLLECALGEIDACRQVIDHESRAFEAYM